MPTPATRNGPPQTPPGPAAEAVSSEGGAKTAIFSGPWDLAALEGRLVEITSGPPPTTSGSSGQTSSPPTSGPVPVLWDVEVPRQRDRARGGALSMAAELLWKAQHRGDPAAWISARPSTFFPPDLEAGGIDLAALVVVRVADASSAARAADKLLRSGAFGLVVLDLGPWAVIPPPLLSRLLGLARRHHAAAVFLTEKADHAPSLAPLVSLRVAASRRRIAPGRFACTVEATKDKRRAPGWTCEETFGGPPGLR